MSLGQGIVVDFVPGKYGYSSIVVKAPLTVWENPLSIKKPLPPSMDANSFFQAGKFMSYLPEINCKDRSAHIGIHGYFCSNSRMVLSC